MRHRFDLRPRRITMQIAALVIGAVAIFHLIATIVFALSNTDLKPRHPAELAGRASALLALIDATPMAERGPLLASLATARTDVSIRRDTETTPPAEQEPLQRGFRRIRAIPGISVWPLGPMAEPRPDAAEELLVRLRDGDMFRVTLPRSSRAPLFGPGLSTLAFLGISLVLLSLWAAKALTRPLNEIAEAARRYSADDIAVALPERGPREVRQLAHAMNQMQARISKFVAERTRMLAAVSHDLRTPITRLRLRAEFMDDQGQRTGMLADLDQMETLVRGTLSYLRDGRGGEPLMPTELPSILMAIRDQYSDMGVSVPYDGPEALRLDIRPNEIQRAVTNLVENALKYAGSARMRLGIAPDGGVAIEVEDDGPGIPDGERDQMQEPFARGDAARTLSNDTGFGLGLTIARAIAEGHGGRLVLADHAPHGLTARIELKPSRTPA
ncbi:ATP-binding protein [Phreatobacter stygius]|uniref:histidine kinase n=1 Tax=Phreatobacter stygius TaxID=1940610 RepID=A0A4D7B8V0_9HYPH|nr:ATP-binding protein [Phreatobacter stygius]QCI65996.1 HAMP domain-containing protein [Phreatobacter stygius]